MITRKQLAKNGWDVRSRFYSESIKKCRDDIIRINYDKIILECSLKKCNLALTKSKGDPKLVWLHIIMGEYLAFKSFELERTSAAVLEYKILERYAKENYNT
jgi:hypothetical protein